MYTIYILFLDERNAAKWIRLTNRDDDDENDEASFS